jgi:hypothetical protein
VPYTHRFYMPGNKFWYWFDYSSIHFVALSSDHNYSYGSEQYLWLGTTAHTLNPNISLLMVWSHVPSPSGFRRTSNRVQSSEEHLDASPQARTEG